MEFQYLGILYSNKILDHLHKKLGKLTEFINMELANLIFSSETTPDELEDHLLSMADLIAFYN